MSSPFSRLRLLSAGAIVLAATAGLWVTACSLNPQPIPPGDNGDDAAAPNDGFNSQGDASGGGTGAGGDAGRMGDAADEATPSPPPDGGTDGGDAGDGGPILDSGDGGG